MRAALVITAILALACGGAATETVDDGAMHVWTVSPGAGHPQVELHLVLEDRVAVYVGGKHSGEITIPVIPESRRDTKGFVMSEIDVDFDGVNDLQVRDDDASGAYNHATWVFRFDPSSSSYTKCDAISGLHNLGVDPDTERVYATSLGNGVGSSGTETYYQANGGCAFEELGTMGWDVGLSNGRGDARCTLVGEEEPVWRMQVTEKPDRKCPE
ncbi:MAG: hypothetical protein R3F61_22420 [Myxococcota bacterium]